MGYGFIGGNAGGVAGGNFPASGMSTVGADLIIGADVTHSTVGFSDNQGNTYTGLTGVNPGGATIKLFYVQAPTTSATHKFVPTGASAGAAVAVFSGSISSPFDNETGNGTTTPSSSIQLNSLTPSATELVVTACASANGQPVANTWAIDGGFTIAGSKADDGNYPIALAYLLSTAGPCAPTWSWTGSGHPVETAGASFKTSAAATAAADTHALMGV